LYLSTADGGRAVTDAVRETIEIVNIGRALQGQPPVAPKNGARFHFDLPGSVQGFMAEDSSLKLENVAGHSATGSNSLALKFPAQVTARAATAVFIPPDALNMPHYELVASPALYPGQTVRAAVAADAGNSSPVTVQLCVDVYQLEETTQFVLGPEKMLAPGESAELVWTIGDLGPFPIFNVGIQLANAASAGTVYLDWLTWDGSPDVTFSYPPEQRIWPQRRPAWLRAWVNGVDHFDPWWAKGFHAIQNEGRGLASQGAREWTDYSVSAPVMVYMAKAAGLGARVQGMRRYCTTMARRVWSRRWMVTRRWQKSISYWNRITFTT